MIDKSRGCDMKKGIIMQQTPTEGEEQAVLFSWAQMNLRKWPELGLLFHVPPHGRLIDADALVDSFDPSDFWNPDAEDNCFAAIHVVNSAPTVIEAEEARDGDR